MPRPRFVVVEVDLENRGCGMVESKSFLDSTRRMVGAWLVEGWRRALHVRVRQAVEGRLCMGLGSRWFVRGWKAVGGWLGKWLCNV